MGLLVCYVLVMINIVKHVKEVISLNDDRINKKLQAGSMMDESTDFRVDKDLGDFEGWEDDNNLLNKGDFEGLKALRFKRLKKNPTDIYEQLRLGEAYVLCKEYEKAIDFMRPIYEKYPDEIDIQHTILDALFGLRKSERDFEWRSFPKVLRLNKEISDYCYEYLKGKRKARELSDVYNELILEGYHVFTIEELLDFLAQDGRFELQKDVHAYCALIKVRKA